MYSRSHVFHTICIPKYIAKLTEKHVRWKPIFSEEVLYRAPLPRPCNDLCTEEIYQVFFQGVIWIFRKISLRWSFRTSAIV